jgi:hypothetical protein
MFGRRSRTRPEGRAIKEQRVRVNDQIRISPVRLIGGDGEQVGIVSLDEAKQRAEDAGLDLVEVAPDARPPVCKLMDYGKYRYEEQRKAREARKEAAHGLGQGGEVPPRDRGPRLRFQDPPRAPLPGRRGQGEGHDDVPGQASCPTRVRARGAGACRCRREGSRKDREPADPRGSDHVHGDRASAQGSLQAASPPEGSLQDPTVAPNSKLEEEPCRR